MIISANFMVIVERVLTCYDFLVEARHIFTATIRILLSYKQLALLPIITVAIRIQPLVAEVSRKHEKQIVIKIRAKY